MVAPVVGAAAISAGAQLLGGMQAAKQAKAGAAAQAAAQNRAIEAMNAVGIPSVEAQQILLQNPELIAKFDPSLVQAVQLDKTAMGDITTDPRYLAAQMSALEGLQQRGVSGLTSEDEALFRDLNRSTAQQASARDASILQNMQEKGAGGSGAELQMRAQAAQQAQQQQAEAADRMAQASYNAKINALTGAANLGGQMQQTQFAQKEKQATAEDAMKQFNAQYLQNARNANVSAQNIAGADYNQRQQNQANTIAANANETQKYNKGLIGQNYQKEMDRAKSLATIYTGQGQQAAQQGTNQSANTMGMFAGLGNAGASALSGYAQQEAADKEGRLKYGADKWNNG